MTNFEDGPAQGLTLILQRAPKFLRVVVSGGGKWDALDQLDDVPGTDEQLFAYELHGNVTSGFWDGRGKDGRRTGGQFAGGTYRFVAEQPTDAQMRTLEAWRAWCQSRI